jgi:beta-glucosidase
VEGIGDFELNVNGVTVLKEALGNEESPYFTPEKPQAWVDLPLERGAQVPVVVRYRWHESHLAFATGIVVREPLSSDEEEMSRAAELAATAYVDIVVVGTSEAVVSEGFDRTDLRLPGRQDELVATVAAANPRTIVVVNAGAPVEMPWRNDVAAVLVDWFPGMEMGSALADVLLGAREPGGRLPTTWPAAVADAPVLSTTPTDGKLRYDEGLHIGHRAYLRRGTTPGYWFGHGLGYTTWSYEDLGVEGTTARVRVRNTGGRRGREVVQVYAARPDSTLDRPAVVLSGYAAVEADPGEQVDVELVLDPRTLRHWDVATSSWRVEPGTLLVSAGPNVGDLPLRAMTSLRADG